MDEDDGFEGLYEIFLLPHRESFVAVKKISEKKIFKKMLYGDICVYYLILMIFVFVCVCVCVCARMRVHVRVRVRVCVCISTLHISETNQPIFVG